MLECTREHAHSKVLVEPTWRNQHSNHHFGRHFEFVFTRVTNHVIIMTPSFSKISVFKMFSVHTKTQSFVFKFLRFQERFRKAPFTVDNFSAEVWKGPQGLAFAETGLSNLILFTCFAKLATA